MRISDSLKSDLQYAGDLVAAGLAAAASVRKCAKDQALKPALGHAVRIAWAPALIGAAVGVLAVCWQHDRRTGRHALLGGLMGGAIGFGSGFACGTRSITAGIARNAVDNVNVVRDAHWLEKNPIAYA
jgi:hypothetical protein